VTRGIWLVAVTVGLGAAMASALTATVVTASPNAQRSEAIEVLAPYQDGDRATFLRVVDQFTKSTGINVKYTLCCPGQPDLATRIAAGNPPDVAVVFRPQDLPTLAHTGDLMTLRSLGLTSADMKRNYASGLLRLASVGHNLYAIPIKANSKSLIWYKPNSFRTHHFAIPKTWNQLLAITLGYKATGLTPWSLGCGPGPEEAWTLTDWFENVYIRTAGPTRYERLFAGRLPFTDVSVVRALKRMLQIITSKYVFGGIHGALDTSFLDGIVNAFGANAKAQLYMEGGFVGQIAIGQVNPSLRPGSTINSMPWPTIVPKWGKQTIGGVDFAVALTNTPAMRRFMRYLASPKAGEAWASAGRILGSVSISPNRRVPLGSYGNLLLANEAHQVATAASFHLDGSDRLPNNLAQTWAAALQNVIRIPVDLKPILSRFERQAHKEFNHGG
jgi:alpha-glucoside transport system substrate-binding protein